MSEEKTKPTQTEKDKFFASSPSGKIAFLKLVAESQPLSLTDDGKL